MAKVLIEQCAAIDSNDLAAQGAFEGGVTLKIEGLGLVRASNITDQLHLTYQVKGRNRKGILRLQRSPCNYGGRRWWFTCPVCGQRCERVYLPPGEIGFRCRSCWNLAYRSQRR